MRYWNMARQRYCCGLARCWRALRLSADRAENAARKRALFGALIEESGSHMTCMGLFLSSGCYWVLLTVLCSEREMRDAVSVAPGEDGRIGAGKG